jgi:hypothetical protein
MKTLTKRITIERLSITSRKPSRDVFVKFNAAVGRPNIEEFWGRMTATSDGAVTQVHSDVQHACGIC